MKNEMQESRVEEVMVQILNSFDVVCFALWCGLKEEMEGHPFDRGSCGKLSVRIGWIWWIKESRTVGPGGSRGEGAVGCEIVGQDRGAEK